MLAATPEGFENAPVTKSLVLGAIVLPVAASLFNVQPYFPLAISPHLTKWHQWFRIVLNSTVFTDQIKAYLAAFLVYECRLNERILGPKKYLKFVITTLVATALLTPVALAASNAISGHSIVLAPGPTGLVAAMLTLYQSLVPPTSLYEIKGIGTFSDKTLLFVCFSAQLLVTSPGALLKSVVGYTVATVLMRFSEM